MDNKSIILFIISGDDAASFTKEEMQQGKHTDYEKQLHDDMIAGLSSTPVGESPPSPTTTLQQDRERGLSKYLIFKQIQR